MLAIKTMLKKVLKLESYTKSLKKSNIKVAKFIELIYK